jgi:hypothetical protein
MHKLMSVCMCSDALDHGRRLTLACTLAPTLFACAGAAAEGARAVSLDEAPVSCGVRCFTWPTVPCSCNAQTCITIIAACSPKRKFERAHPLNICQCFVPSPTPTYARFNRLMHRSNAITVTDGRVAFVAGMRSQERYTRSVRTLAVISRLAWTLLPTCLWTRPGLGWQSAFTAPHFHPSVYPRRPPSPPPPPFHFNLSSCLLLLHFYLDLSIARCHRARTAHHLASIICTHARPHWPIRPPVYPPTNSLFSFRRATFELTRTPRHSFFNHQPPLFLCSARPLHQIRVGRHVLGVADPTRVHPR